MQFIPDIPIEHPNQDFMFHSEDAENLVDILLEAIGVGGNESLSVAILGDWGSGKSGFLNLMKHFLSLKSQKNFVHFDAWEHEQSENILAPLARCVRGNDETAVQKVEAAAESAVRLLADTALNWSKLPDTKTMQETFDDAKKKRMLDDLSYEKEKEVLTKMLFGSRPKRGKSENKLAFFFIDNLDRCNPDNAIKLLDQVKTFLNIPGCIWIFAADPVAISAFIKQKYHGAEFGPYQYLEKIFSFTYHIPTPEIACIQEYVERKIARPEYVSEDELKWLLTLFFQSRKLGVPRRMNRALMRFDLYCARVRKEEKELGFTPSGVQGWYNTKGAAIWICIYEGWPELFLWARNNLSLFRSFIRLLALESFETRDIRAANLELNEDEIIYIRGLSFPEDFRMDENFKEFIGKLSNLCVTHDHEFEKETLQTFFRVVPYLEYIAATGIP